MDISLNSLYKLEIDVNKYIQEQFSNGETILRNINHYLDPVFILNIWIPLVGAFNHKLLVQLVASIGVINTLATVIKWCLPEYRPIWFISENLKSSKYDFNDITIDPFSCDTSAGFPSTHAVAFTTFVFIVVWRFVTSFLSSYEFVVYDKYLLIYAIASSISTVMWFSRLYFLYEFLHQCIVGSLFAVLMIHILRRYSLSLLSFGKVKAMLLVIVLGCIPISAYFGMLHWDVDPFWCVRTAFKWCPDPMQLKHESTPVFTLCRDFGYLLGIALSSPLAKSYYNSNHNYRKRLPALICMEIFNYIVQSYTPKEYGRFAFVAYEFLRNCFHSFMLLTMLPKF
ncbi:glucose-6-phosphatase [Lucilia sericata]|uniref:glucose-6-phosphatase n=1 Tax=Lucilia sericata TaxID=13632 RepID=UPI0018A80DF7|nr:glucose-6-phosphatase [Lucilia sericata]